jgi:hypothetical protein
MMTNHPGRLKIYAAAGCTIVFVDESRNRLALVLQALRRPPERRRIPGQETGRSRAWPTAARMR